MVVAAFSVLSRPAQAGCRNPNLVIGDPPIQFVAAHGPIEIKWFGHAFFQLTTASGTRIITDPFGAMGFPMPDVSADVVTVGREHGNHANVGLVKGNPLVLHGVRQDDSGWNYINTTFRDALIYNVPIHQRGMPQDWGLRGSAFVFEVDGLCVLHSGDVSEPFNEDQLQMIGHVDVLLQTIGGVFTVGPEGAQEIIEQLKPKIVIPMHYWNYNNALERFTQGPYKVVTPDSNTFTVSKDTLPPETEIVVLKVKMDGEI
jgi:L-ascorbate metabolism protein UlaG (beta-lactamase superfamily)